MWFLLSILSAIIYSFRGVLEKKTIQNVDKFVLGLAIRLFAFPFFFLPFIFNPKLAEPLFQTNLNFWFAVIFVSFICTPVETYFYYSALKDEELTTVLPILSLGPILTLFIGSFTLKEVPTIFGLLGVVMITFGIYTLKIQHAREGFLEPIKHLGKNKAIQFMFIVMVSQSVGAIFDKVGVSNANAYIYAFFNYFFVCISLSIIAMIKARQHLKQILINYKTFIIISFIIASYTLLYLSALESGFAAYVSAIKNTYILFSIILGLVFLKETEGKQKIFAGLIIVIGLVLVKVFA
ncbi:MAG TPA: DMT family transporter [Xanthomonadales bacterium]|nr:DMT family transporter [Xanthomonadales bacterium]